jgi:hypothetical protein
MSHLANCRRNEWFTNRTVYPVRTAMPIISLFPVKIQIGPRLFSIRRNKYVANDITSETPLEPGQGETP